MVSTVSGATAALRGQINRDQLDLNDWVTCVSAKTPKGKAEIQKIAGEISAAKEQIGRIEATQSSASTNPANPATTTSLAAAGSARTASHSGAVKVGGLIDTWA
jgi:hypothetical protein